MHCIWLPSPLFMQIWVRYHQFYKVEKNNPAPPLPRHLSTWQCQTSITATVLSDAVETRQLAGDYWLGANATAVLNIYASEYPHFGFSGGFGGARLAVQARYISGVKANLKRLVIILCNTCRQMPWTEIFKSKQLYVLSVGQENQKVCSNNLTK